jgi:preprotein translocase subunit SecA
MAKAEMRKQGIPEELISEADAHSETDNEEILNARRMFRELAEKYRQQTKAEAEEVKAAGGLYIIGTERHESRRIDNQLRGRSGRQGDPGMSRFYISLEDDLMRLFGGDRINMLMERLKVDEDMPIENKMLTNTIESAQRKIEGRNFGIRKNVLQFDDVMNRQREIIYSQRDQVLNGENLKEQILKMIDQAIEEQVARYMPKGVEPENRNFNGLRDHYMGWLIGPEDLNYTDEEKVRLEPEDVARDLIEKAHEIYEQREKQFGSKIMRELERVVLLKNVDTQWMDHIDAMEELKRGIRLRAYGQKDPVVEYRMEGFDMFDNMIAAIRENTARMMLTVQIRTQEEPKREQVAKPTGTAGGAAASTNNAHTPVRKGKKPGRNDPCPCGSGKKYKKCCGRYES